MKAMILAAGFGTRLMPLTSNIPKPLVPVGNIPVIDRLIRYLKSHGIRKIIVNAHHHHQQLADHLTGEKSYGVDIEVRVEPRILGTGGGIENTRDFWDAEPFVVVNGDIITDLDLGSVIEKHLKFGNLSTLVLHDYPPFNQIRIDNHLNLIDISAGNQPGRFAFTGIHVMDPKILDHIPPRRYSDIIDCYRYLIKAGEPVRACLVHGHYWRDIGSIKSYVLANKAYTNETPFLMAPGCRMHDSAGLKDWAVIGKNVQMEENVEIRRSILWNDARIKSGVKVVDSIVTSKEVKRDLIGEVY